MEYVPTLKQLRYNRTLLSNRVRRTIDWMLTSAAPHVDPSGLPSWWPFWSDALKRNVRELVAAARELKDAEEAQDGVVIGATGIGVALLCALLATACHDSEGIANALGSLPTSPTPQVGLSCPVVPLTITHKAQDGSGPYLTLVLGQAFDEVTLSLHGTKVVLDAVEHLERGTTTITRQQVEFSQTYQVQGRIGSCWSLPVDVPIQDRNVDASGAGGGVVPVPEPTRNNATTPVCTSMVFTPDSAPVRLEIDAPHGVRVITRDDNHEAGYQPEQKWEQLRVTGERNTGALVDLGLTPDIPERDKAIGIEFVTPWPLRAVTLSHQGQGSSPNSVHGACIEAL